MVKGLKNNLLKTIILLIYSPLTIIAASELGITWYGTTCISISDSKTTLFFDPFLTRPSLWKVISLQNLESSDESIDKWIDMKAAIDIKGIFVSHNHYDHTLDLVKVAKKASKAIIYGDSSTKNIALGGGIKGKRIRLLEAQRPIEIADFTITPIRSEHPPHFMGMTFADGKVDHPLKKGSVLNYKAGSNFNFHIRHKRGGSILFAPSPIPIKETPKVEILIQGIARRTSSMDIIKNYILPSKAKIIIPVHHDNFFSPLTEGFKELPLVNYDEFKKSVSENVKKVEFRQLEYGKTFRAEL